MGTRIISLLTLVLVLMAPVVFAQELSLSPPVINFYNNQLGNSEIYYIGGTSSVPGATIIVYLQKENGSILAQETIVNEVGEWFYSHPEFLSKGSYNVWIQLKVGDLVSPPSHTVKFEVASTALQIGDTRITKESLYFFFTMIFILASLLLGGFIIYHFRQHRKKSSLFAQEINKAEQLVHHGFIALQSDLKARLKMSGGGKNKGEKMLEDLKDIEKHLKELST